MNEFLVAFVVFLCLTAASLGSMHLFPKMPARHRDDETSTVVRLVANIFVVMASLVFGLMINSSKNTYENVDAMFHDFGTNLILFDHALRAVGPETAQVRAGLAAYVAEAIANPTRADDALATQPDRTGAALEKVREELRLVRPASAHAEIMLQEARQIYRRVVELRWSIVEKSEGTIPMPLIWLLVAWLTLVFASFGHRAPSNAVAVASFLCAAFLIAGAFYLVLDMSVPFRGPIQVSPAPLHRALAEMRL